MMFPFRIGSDVILRFPVNGAADPDPAPPSPLPEGYTLLNYIQSSGGQWIDPNMIKPESTDSVRIQIKFSPTYISGNDQSVVAGAHPGYGSLDAYNVYIGYSSNMYIGAATGRGSDAAGWLPSDYPPASGADYMVDTTFEGSALTGTINNTSFSYTLPKAIETGLALFAGGVGDNYGVRGFAYAKIYYCRIYVNNELVHNLLPCIRDADSKIGMYDAVQEAFLTNGGSGADFTGG